MLGSLFAHVPFEQYRVVDTADLDEAHPWICDALNSARLRVLRGRINDNRLDWLSCGQLSLLQLRYGNGAEVAIDPECLDGYYLLVLPTRGRALFHFERRLIEVSPQGAVLISPGRRFHFQANADYEQILLRLNLSVVDEAWRRLTAQDQAPDIGFDAVIPLHSAAWQAILPMLQWVTRCSVLGQGSNVAQAALLAQTEILVATTLLLHQPHSMAAHLWPAPPPSMPQSVRRAQAFMLEHLGERLAVAMVAGHCGLSVRRLQAVFQDACGQSPLQWLRQRRLQAIRRELQQGDPDVGIADIAERFGFSHLGEFSKAYRDAFGETPSRTRRG